MTLIRNANRCMSSCVTLAAISYLVGCAATDETEIDEPVGATEAPLYRTGARWPVNMSTAKGAWIPVCYTFDTNQIKTTTDKSDATNFIKRVRGYVENTWARVADIYFDGWGECAGSNNGKLVVTLTKSARSGSAVGYQGSGTPTGMTLDIMVTAQPVVAVHEFGHALGFDHEFTRTDFPCSVGAQGCVSCKTNADCSAAAADPPNYGNTCVAGFCRYTTGEELVNTTTADRESVMASTYVTNTIDINDRDSVASPTGSLSVYDVLGAQQIYGRKPAGSLVGLGGRCADIAGGTMTYGSSIVAWPCTSGPNDRWQYNPANGHLGSLLSTGLFVTPTMCANISGGTVSSSSSTPLISWGCGAYSNEVFNFENVQIRAMGNMCLVATGTSAGAYVEARACDGASTSRSRWKVINRNITQGDIPVDYSAIQLAGTNLCMTVGSYANGDQITLRSCTSSTYRRSQAFEAVHGTLRIADSASLCLNVLGGTDATGQRLGLWNACSPDYNNSYFSLTGPIKGLGQCVELLGGDSYAGAGIGMNTCSTNAARQEWDYHWL
jgi:hypothetical protein